MLPRSLALALACVLTSAVTCLAASTPRLSYSAAKRAIQAKADHVAGTRTRITALYKLGAATYSGRAEWTRVNPTGCTGCGYDPITGAITDTPENESCSLDMHAKRLNSGRVRVSIENSACY
jgi:hypothetical protein